MGKLGRPLRKTPRLNRYGVCHKCGDLHTNLNRHSSGCDQTPTRTLPSHRSELAEEPGDRSQATPPAPAADDTTNHRLLPWSIEDVGPTLDALDGMTLATMSLSTAKVVRQEHRIPFARSMRHALRIFCQAHNALQVAPSGSPNAAALATNLERATKLLHITPAILQSSDGRCSRQGRYNDYARGELAGLIDWLVVFAGRGRQKPCLLYTSPSPRD